MDAQPTPQADETEVVQSWTPSRSKWPWVSLVVVLLIATGIGGIFLGKKLTVPYVSRPPFTAAPTTELDPTANWKTYTNQKYGFEIKHPINWTEQVRCQGGAVDDDYICFLSPDFSQSDGGAVMGSTLKGGLLWIDGSGDLVGSSLAEFCNSENIQFTNCKEISVAGMKAMQRTWSSTTQVGIINDNKFILSFRMAYNPQSEKDMLQAFNQILSTFRFTDSSQLYDISGGTKLTSACGFSLEYPENFIVKISNSCPNMHQQVGYISNNDVTKPLRINIYVDQYPKSTDFDDEINAYLGWPKADQISTRVGSYPAIKLKIHYNEQAAPGGIGGFSTGILVLKDGKFYQFNVIGHDSTLPMWDQILSTFKFTNQ